MSDRHFPLSLQGVERTFVQGDRRLPVLQGVSLDLQAGEIVALVGQSGSGKSTMLHIAGLLEKPDGGDVIVDGRSAGAQNDGLRGSSLFSKRFTGATSVRSTRRWHGDTLFLRSQLPRLSRLVCCSTIYQRDSFRRRTSVRFSSPSKRWKIFRFRP